MRSTDQPSYEALYHQLVRLRDEMPWGKAFSGPDGRRWLARAVALVEATGFVKEIVSLRVQVENAAVYGLLDASPALATTVEIVIAKLELMLPTQAQGAFIPAGGIFDAFQAVTKAVGEAKSDVLFVDPYADATLITDFAPLAPEQVQVRVLTDTSTVQPSLKPAAERWIAQHRTRPLQVRRAASGSLHDRLILTDGSVAWVLGQSFKDLAKRKPSYLQRMDPESAALKISAYKAIWEAATPLT